MDKAIGNASRKPTKTVHAILYKLKIGRSWSVRCLIGATEEAAYEEWERVKGRCGKAGWDWWWISAQKLEVYR